MFERFTALRKAAEICRVRSVAIAFVAVVLFSGGLAQAADKQVNLNTSKDEPPLTWAGLGFGLGIAADFDIGGKRVADATIINNIVRVTDTTSNVDLGFVLEAHYFIRDWLLPGKGRADPYCSVFCMIDVATGPFVALEINGGSSATVGNVGGPITGYALGWMVGLHHVDASPHSSWNFGVGLRLDPSTKILGDGFVANQAPPPGETSVRFLKEPRAGLMLLSSFSF
jgi:hypothetical protein